MSSSSSRRRSTPSPGAGARRRRSEGDTIEGPLGRGSGDLRRHNLATVLGVVHQRGTTTRAELTRALGLNRSTVGDLVSGLVEAGLVLEERGESDGTGKVGRPSLVVAPRADTVSVLSVRLDVHSLEVARVALAGHVLERRVAPSPTDPAAVVGLVLDLAAELLDASARDGLLGVGVGVPGTVHRVRGTIASAPNLGWVDVPLAGMVAEAMSVRWGVDVDVYVANDADLGVLAERTRGAAVGCGDVVYLSGTYGLGGGVVSGGHPVTGSRGYAGEVGHLSVDPGGRACRCGGRGCWESEASAAAWAEPLDLDAEAPDISARILARLDAGGVAARRTRDKVSRTFARGLAGVINVFDPQMVLLGSGLWQDLWPAVADDVLPWVERLVMPALREGTVVRLAGLGADSTVLGAAELAFASLLADPLGVVPGARTRAGR